MELKLQNNQKQKHQQTAQQLLDHSVVLRQLFQDQWFYLWTITPENLFEIDEDSKQLSIADRLLTLSFSESSDHLIDFSTPHSDVSVQSIADFVVNEFLFLLRNLKVQHSLYLQTKVQLFRQLLVEQVFQWVDGENRIEQYLYNLTVSQAETIDQIMMDAEYYTEAHLTAYAAHGISIPLSVELNFKHLSLVNSILGENFLAVKKLIPQYDQLCFSAEKFIPAPFYRMIQTTSDEKFKLADVIAHEADFKLLATHAKQQPHLLAFTQWMKRGYWQYSDIFSKKNFTTLTSPYWDERISTKFPLFYYRRAVNWLFKQEVEVTDWVAKYLDDINVRIAVTALSFVDTSQIHPHLIKLTLKYFKTIAGRLFLHECSTFANQHQWLSKFDASKNKQNIKYLKHFYSLHTVDSKQLSNERNEISVSILYLEEWMHLLQLMSKDDLGIAKQVFKRISRLMQSYMLFMQNLIQDLPEGLIEFIEPHTQEHPQFLGKLKQHQIELTHFRKKFKHPVIQFNRNTSVFDSYVADYLVDFFYQNRNLAKNVTWSGLYQQAVRWHQQIHYQDTLSKLRLKIHIDTWRRISPHEIMFSEHWKFIELNSLEQIINESNSYRHCLALSYTERIADGEYVAFHMSSLENEDIHMTLGCYYKFDKLHFDQLRLPNNQHASKEYEQEARLFIQQVNQHLIWDFKAPKVQ